MTRFRIPPQITRLLLVTLLILVSYYVARLFLIPESFGRYGWYRAEALEDYQKLPLRYAGKVSCNDCHADVVEIKDQGGHKMLSCEGCHGPSATHVENQAVLPVKPENRNFCIRCHEQNSARPSSVPQVIPSEHSQGMTCLDCHLPHQPLESP